MADVWPNADESGNITLILKKGSVILTSPVTIQMGADAQNYGPMIISSKGGTLNAGGANYWDLWIYDPSNPEEEEKAAQQQQDDQQKANQQFADINKKIDKTAQDTQNVTDMNNQYNLDQYRTQFPSFPANYNDLSPSQIDDLNHFRGWIQPYVPPPVVIAGPRTPYGITSIVKDNIIDIVNHDDAKFGQIANNPVALAKAYWILLNWNAVNPYYKAHGFEQKAFTKVQQAEKNDDGTDFEKLRNGHYTQADVEDLFAPLNPALTSYTGSGMKRKYKRKVKK
jgi:hypothetical protein